MTTPIEAGCSLAVPFLLRRALAEVEQDLPEKTEIVENIELDSDQRDLYEGIRLAMHAKRGARTHIIILDAFLKLRQVCCDLRLLKLDAAKKVHCSAKLARLMDMLPAMIEEDRRRLLLSQFTSMLSLIEVELKAQPRRRPVRHRRQDGHPLRLGMTAELF